MAESPCDFQRRRGLESGGGDLQLPRMAIAATGQIDGTTGAAGAAHWPMAGGLLVLAIAAVAALALWHLRFRTYHLAEVKAGALYRDGNRSIREFTNALRRTGTRTVVMLLEGKELDKPQVRAEIEHCRREGIELVHIPVVVGQRPSAEQVKRFLEIAADSAKQPVLVHCAQGVRRTAMMVAAFQEAVMGMSDAQTKASILLFGRRPEALDDVRGFIDDFDGKTLELRTEHVIYRPQDED